MPVHIRRYYCSPPARYSGGGESRGGRGDLAKNSSTEPASTAALYSVHQGKFLVHQAKFLPPRLPRLFSFLAAVGVAATALTDAGFGGRKLASGGEATTSGTGGLFAQLSANGNGATKG